MKNNLKLALVAATFVFAFSNANANPYLAISYQNNQLSLSSEQISNFTINSEDFLEKDFDNAKISAGINITPNLDLELGYFSKKDAKKSNNSTGLVFVDTDGNLTTDSKTDLRIIDLTAIYSIPVHEKIKFLMLGSLSKIDYNYSVDLKDDGVSRANISKDDSGFGYGVGLGLEAELIKNIAARAIIKYSKTVSLDVVDDLTAYEVGLKYQF